eukprot:COSAG05_NODE_9_length_39734_cov_180.598067_22_plen_657_part_00
MQGAAVIIGLPFLVGVVAAQLVHDVSRRLQKHGGNTSCPAGTTASYAGDTLAFRFQPDGITRDNGGSLVWNAAVPNGLAFVENRTIVNGSSVPDEMTDHELYRDFRVASPHVVSTSAGAPSGLLFSSLPAPAPHIAMYANQTMAFGAKHTFFAVVTPTAGKPVMVETILAFRGGAYTLGCFAWYIGWMTLPSSSQRVFIADTWGVSGFQGPVLETLKTQILIARSHYGVDAAGRSGPVVELATVSMSSSSELVEPVYMSTMYGNGLKEYNFEQTETFDLDFRDPSTDGLHAVGAGYAQLGNSALLYASIFQLQGTVHHLELHSNTLSDAHVADVVRQLRYTLSNATSPPACTACPKGTRDHDNDPTTPCEPCAAGTFSALIAMTECNGTCALGSTILSTGATSSAACSQCVAGQYGGIDVNARAMCWPCKAGRASTQLGATSNSSCARCAAGRFSALASATCQPSGCTDHWADNFNPFAVIDEGMCVYTCSTVRTRAGSGIGDPGGCVLHDPTVGWRRFTHNNTVLTGGSLSTIPSHESWVVQGRPRDGSTNHVSLPQAYPMRLEFKGGGNLTVRYILRAGGTRGFSFFQVSANDGKAVITLAHVVVADSNNVGQHTGPASGFEGADIRFSDATFSHNIGPPVSYCVVCFPLVSPD